MARLVSLILGLGLLSSSTFHAGQSTPEVLQQFLGLPPGDSRMEPYWALAEEFDLPAGIHMGPGPPGAAYESSPVPVKHPEFRMAHGDPLLLEEVLLRHKRLRLFVMHAGWPRLESMRSSRRIS